MKKQILAILGALLSVLGAADFSMSVVSEALISVQSGNGDIKDSDQIIVGSSGVVMHKFSDGSKSIIARAVVSDKAAGTAKVRFEQFNSLEQGALPVPKILPAAGDEVVLNYLYDRSLAVVPNKKIFDEITAAFPNISFIHPDIVGAYLHYEYKPNPSRDDFRKMCAKSAAGLIFFALDGEAVFADCGSFAVLKSFKSGRVSEYQLPFYTRVEGIDTIFWKLDSEKINDYDQYYRDLLEH